MRALGNAVLKIYAYSVDLLKLLARLLNVKFATFEFKIESGK